MGYYKEHSILVVERGYEDSDKCICAGCIGEKYFAKFIHSTGEIDECSFCGKHRKVLPMNDILKTIAAVIKRDYLPALGNAFYDSEEHKYWDADGVMCPYDFVYEELNQYLESENEKFLQELVDKLAFEDRLPAYKFAMRQEEIDMERWNEYCQLVRSSQLSSEQIVGLINSENKKNVPKDLIRIRNILDMVYGYCRELGLVKVIEGINSKRRATDIYRCVNFLPRNLNYAGLEFIPATLVGTVPAKNVVDNRMSEQGDMMFYGADNKKVAMIEVGRNSTQASYPATMGMFHSSKRFQILNLADLATDKRPSIFDIEHENKRSVWYFLNEFIESISQPRNDEDNFYKPTQVFTKYIQRNTDMQGIKFKSSKANGNCYVLFVVNRDCLDKGNKIDLRRSQLVMDKVEQVDFSDEGL